MEKTIFLGDKEVHLTSSVATALIYKAQFNHDYFSDLMILSKIMESMKNDDTESDEVDLKNTSVKTLGDFDMSVLYNVIWAFAKNNDRSTPEPIEFFSQFESMDMEAVMIDVTDMIAASVKTTKK